MSLSASTTAPILVIDDDRDVRETVSDVLGGAGYAVAEAADGAEALRELHDGLRPSMILLDLRMPVMDGEAFCREWKADPAIANIPVVLFSAERDAATVAARCGTTAYLKKPPCFFALLELTQRLTHRDTGSHPQR